MQVFPTQPDYAVTAPLTEHRTMEMAMNKRLDQIVQVTKMPPTIHHNQNKRFPMKSLAELQQRKLQVISQLEKVVGKNAATIISNTASTQAKQDSSPIGEFEGTPPYIFWTGTINSGPTFVRSDSILKAEDDYVPFDTPISKYGPISRMSNKDNITNTQSVQVSSTFGDNTISTSMVRRPVSAPSPAYSNIMTLNSGHPMVCPLSIREGSYITLGNGIYEPQQRVTDKDLLAESHRVKMQLRSLEKKINDLKIASQGVTLSEKDRLTQELQLIEQGIFEKQKEVKLVSTIYFAELNLTERTRLNYPFAVCS